METVVFMARIAIIAVAVVLRLKEIVPHSLVTEYQNAVDQGPVDQNILVHQSRTERKDRRLIHFQIQHRAISN